MALLRRGLAGEPVRILQEKLGVEADGVFGQATDAALRQYQQDNGLSADGIAGPDTFSSMGLYELVLLHRPIRGELVKRVQAALGIDADGVFGQGTEAAVKGYQEQNGLEVTGTVTPNMLAMLGFEEFTPDKIEASVITENTPIVDEAVQRNYAEQEQPPPDHDPSLVSKVTDAVGGAIHTVEDRAASIGKSIWGTVRSIF